MPQGAACHLKEENRNCLRNMGTVIYLDVDEEGSLASVSGWMRVALCLRARTPEKKYMTLLRQREAIYRESAHWIVPVKDEGAWQLAEEIEKIVKSA